MKLGEVWAVGHVNAVNCLYGSYTLHSAEALGLLARLYAAINDIAAYERTVAGYLLKEKLKIQILKATSSTQPNRYSN